MVYLERKELLDSLVLLETQDQQGKRVFQALKVLKDRKVPRGLQDLRSAVQQDQQALQDLRDL